MLVRQISHAGETDFTWITFLVLPEALLAVDCGTVSMRQFSRG